jgi:hypothetical protein
MEGRQTDAGPDQLLAACLESQGAAGAAGAWVAGAEVVGAKGMGVGAVEEEAGVVVAATSGVVGAAAEAARVAAPHLRTPHQTYRWLRQLPRVDTCASAEPDA